MTKLLYTLAILACAGACASGAVNPGDEVIIVYNSRVPESREVAEYYAQRRQVPTNQIFGFALSTNEEFSRIEFHDKLEKPLAKALGEAKLWHISSQIIHSTNNQATRLEWRVTESKIRYAVLCYGVPLRIAEDPNHKEDGLEKLRPEMRRNVAAVDSELALLPLTEQKIPLAGPLRNMFYTATNEAAFHPTNGVLMVARLDGPSAAIARGLVDKALEAETNGLWGRAYFDIRNTTEAGFKLGDDWMRGAAEICRRLGFETVVDENPSTFPSSFPMSQIAFYMGWYTERVCGPFARPAVEFMPGAFAYHLHSYSALTIRSATQHWVGPLLAKGATITMGCVDEPYLAGTPDVAVFTGRFVYAGFTFGEAACACQPVLSWQTTVVGDPLYRPFGRNPDQLQDDLLRRQSRLLEWSYLRLADFNLANGKSVDEILIFLEPLEITKQSAVLSEKIGDLCVAQGKPSSAIHAYLQALRLGPSPQQRARITLPLGEKLIGLNREQEAYEVYQQLLQDFPDYADKLSICKRLLPLAQKLQKKADVDRYEAEIKTLSVANR
jgi:uncharacterized protein (TIGR03790 family)